VEEEIIRVDSRRARRALVLVGGGLVLACIVMYLVYAHFRDAMPNRDTYISMERYAELRFQLQLTFLAVFGLLAAIFLLLAVHGVKALHHGVLPLPGAIIFRDTREVRGFPVLWRGYASVAIGILGVFSMLYCGCLFVTQLNR
jgi:hypothetical protein